jgi:hypothetical protein
VPPRERAWSAVEHFSPGIEPLPRTARRAFLAGTAAVSIAAATSGALGQSARVSEDSFANRFEGTWVGSGSVQRGIDARPWRVNCTLTGNRTANRLSIGGSCRAALIIQRRIGADLTFDPQSGEYRGTYVGARVGPAQLSGRRSGDVVNLTIAWPKPVNGDLRAMMSIRNDGSGTLRITVTDSLTADGPLTQTSDLMLRQR